MTPAGVIEVIRTWDGYTPPRRIRHRRMSGGDSWWVRIKCSRNGEGIVAPFDDEDAPLCPDCWGEQ